MDFQKCLSGSIQCTYFFQIPWNLGTFTLSGFQIYIPVFPVVGSPPTNPHLSPPHLVSWSSAGNLENQKSMGLTWMWTSSLRRSKPPEAGEYFLSGVRWSGSFHTWKSQLGCGQEGTVSVQHLGTWKYRFILSITYKCVWSLWRVLRCWQWRGWAETAICGWRLESGSCRTQALPQAWNVQPCLMASSQLC